MDTPQTNTHFFTNKGENTLIREFEGVLRNNPDIKNFDAVVGFLRASGYFSLRPFLNNINKARILIGIDTDKYIAKAARQGKMFFGAEEEVNADCLQKMRDDIEHSAYKKEVEDGIHQMVKDVADGKLELRTHPSKKIHAKIYVLYPDDLNQYKPCIAITGSSNLSGNGLGIAEEKQYELNVKLSQYDDVKFAKDEFEELWREAEGCEITAEDLGNVTEGTYIGRDATPYELYVKMLIEYFANRVLAADEDENPLEMPTGYAKYDYQTDAVAEGYQKLIDNDGLFLADVVGLGKTVIATMIAKKFLNENGHRNTKILVVYPPALEQNWKTTFADFGIDKYAKFISNGSLDKVLDRENYNYWRAEDYDLVLVDEAHKFRNTDTGAFKLLQEICKTPRANQGQIKGYKKKVMLISATPMNNSPRDIYNEILLFQNPRRCTIEGVPNLTATFAPFIEEFRQLRKKQEAGDASCQASAEYKKLAEQIREKIIKPLTVRRTRSDIESVPRYKKDVGEFPKVEPPIEERYELNDHTADLFEKAMRLLTKDLSYVRYKAIEYLKDTRGLYDNTERVSLSLAFIRKTGLVKRLESSFEAFKKSVKTFRKANQNMIEMLENNKVFIAPDLNINSLIDDGLSWEEIEEKVEEKARQNPRNSAFEAKDFKPDFIENLRRDQKILDQMDKDWESVTDKDDSKFDKFNDLLNREFFKSELNPEGKLVVFSESVDTVKYLAGRITREDVLVITAENRGRLFKTIGKNFDANCKTKRDDYNIVLTTEVLAEGVNLHRANVIVNYDTPWNATRLIQRIGRVNRIGSASKHIYNYVFYPSRQGNREIKLNQIVLGKIQTFHSTYGEDSQIYSQTEELVDHDGRIKLFNDAIQSQMQEEGRDPELPFFEELRTLYKNNRQEYDRIAKLPLRSRTGRSARCIDKATLENCSLVFLKTNLRKEFFLVSGKKEEAEALSAIDALKYFKATPKEPAVKRIGQHHEHVGKALRKFHARQEEEARTQESMQSEPASRGAQVSAALSLIDAFTREITDAEQLRKVKLLRSLVEQGVITEFTQRLQTMQKKLKKGGPSRMTHDAALREILQMAERATDFSAHATEGGAPLEEETEAEIVLSESFKERA